MLICGPTRVGKSTIGLQLHLRTLRAGLTAGYVDLDQVGFVSPGRADDPHQHRLKARNLAAMWQTYRARHVVATGQVQDEASFRRYTDALPAATITLCRLHASPADLTWRIVSRGAGGSWPHPGDPLRGQPDGYLRQADEGRRRREPGARRIRNGANRQRRPPPPRRRRRPDRRGNGLAGTSAPQERYRSGHFVVRAGVSLRPGWLSSGKAAGKVAAAFFSNSPSAEVPRTAVTLLWACCACS